MSRRVTPCHAMLGHAMRPPPSSVESRVYHEPSHALPCLAMSGAHGNTIASAMSDHSHTQPPSPSPQPSIHQPQPANQPVSSPLLSNPGQSVSQSVSLRCRSRPRQHTCCTVFLLFMHAPRWERMEPPPITCHHMPCHVMPCLHMPSGPPFLALPCLALPCQASPTLQRPNLP